MKATLLLLLSLLALGANAVEVGAKLDSWTLPDQFDQTYELADDV